MLLLGRFSVHKGNDSITWCWVSLGAVGLASQLGDFSSVMYFKKKHQCNLAGDHLQHSFCLQMKVFAHLLSSLICCHGCHGDITCREKIAWQLQVHIWHAPFPLVHINYNFQSSWKNIWVRINFNKLFEPCHVSPITSNAALINLFNVFLLARIVLFIRRICRTQKEIKVNKNFG